MKKRLRIHSGTCDCSIKSILAEGLQVENAASEKHAARLLKKAFTSGKTHYIVHFKGKHVTQGHVGGHWYPHFRDCKEMKC